MQLTVEQLDHLLSTIADCLVEGEDVDLGDGFGCFENANGSGVQFRPGKRLPRGNEREDD